MHPRLALTSLSCACALGRTNDDVLAHARAGSTAGMIALDGDIPGRSVLFGRVPGDLPRIAEPCYAMRTNQLLLHAVDNFRATVEAFFARHAAERVAIVLGASNTGIDEAQRGVDAWLDTGAKPETLDFSQIELGTPSDYLRHLLGVKGPCYTVSTACSSSTKAFASARRLIETGVVDAALVGGVDGRCRFALNGFHALGALAQGLCRPLAPDRDGINLGEAVALFTLERIDESSASCASHQAPDTKHQALSTQRQALIVLKGYGSSSDAHHATAPDPEGRGAEAAMRAALADAGLTPGDIGYVNLHGTGTVANDSMELAAVHRIFPQLPTLVESTKALTGHCLGAAGAIEAALCWLKLAAGDIAGAAMSNSFAFGGANASVILAREEA